LKVIEDFYAKIKLYSMNYSMNAAIQVLPTGDKKFIYSVVDRVIEHIGKSGLKYRVCPFETVVEGDYDRVVRLIGEIREICFLEGVEDLLINMKWQIGNRKNITISDKMEKYDK
jgi:uncharacterized protein YqgV (UPF0045/DUF77 family)